MPDALIFLIELPAAPDSVRAMRETAAAFVRDAGADARTVEDAKLVVSEAATNAVLHAYPDQPTGCLQLHGRVDGEEVLLLIEDQGCGPQVRSANPGLGMGLKIIAGSSRSDVTERNGGGTSVCVRFDLPADRLQPAECRTSRL